MKFLAVAAFAAFLAPALAASASDLMRPVVLTPLDDQTLQKVHAQGDAHACGLYFVGVPTDEDDPAVIFGSAEVNPAIIWALHRSKVVIVIDPAAIHPTAVHDLSDGSQVPRIIVRMTAAEAARAQPCLLPPTTSAKPGHSI